MPTGGVLNASAPKGGATVSPAPGTLVGVTQYAPGSQVLYTPGLSFAALDAANLSLTCTPGASGKLLVSLSAIAYNQAASNANGLWFFLYSVGAASRVGPVSTAGFASVASPLILPTVTDHLIPGLTPFVPVTLQWWAAQQTGAIWILIVGDDAPVPAQNNAPATMKAWTL